MIKRLLMLFLPLALVLALMMAWASDRSVKVQLHGAPEQYRTTLLSSLSLNQNRQYALSSALALQTTYKQGFDELKLALQGLGYFNPEISGNVNFDKDSKTWLISYNIITGAPMKIDRLHLSVRGDKTIKQDLSQLAKSSPLSVGHVLILDDYKTLKDKMLNKANSLGYFQAKMTGHKIKIQKNANKAAIELAMDAGPRYKFGSIKFEQQKHILNDSFLHRFVPFKTGEYYHVDDIRTLQQHLNASGYFRAVTVTPRPDDSSQKVPVEASLIPQKPFQYSVGAGYGTDTGIRGLLGWKWRYITKDGQHANAQIQASKIHTIFSANYVMPGQKPLQEDITLHAASGQTKLTTYNANDTSVGLSRTLLWHSLVVKMALIQHWIKYNTVAQPKDQSVKYILPDISLHYQQVAHKQGYYWHQGWLANLNVTGTLKNPLSTSSFAQAQLSLRQTFNLSASNRIYARQSVGGTIHDGSINKLAPTYRFYVGGTGSVRGFDFLGLGPRNSDGKVVGGSYLLTGSLNLEHHFFGNWSGSIFTDAGSAFDNKNSIKLDQSVGVGMSWKSPVGPINLYLAHPLGRSHSGVRFDISIGGFLP